MASLVRVQQKEERTCLGTQSSFWIPIIAFIAPALIIYAGFTLFPVLKTIYNSLHVMKPHNTVEFVGLGNYRALLTHDLVF